MRVFDCYSPGSTERGYIFQDPAERASQDRIMFGCDYQVLKFEMKSDRWQSLVLPEGVPGKVCYKNAEAYFPDAAVEE